MWGSFRTKIEISYGYEAVYYEILVNFALV